MHAGLERRPGLDQLVPVPDQLPQPPHRGGAIHDSATSPRHSSQANSAASRASVLTHRLCIDAIPFGCARCTSCPAACSASTAWCPSHSRVAMKDHVGWEAAVKEGYAAQRQFVGVDLARQRSVIARMDPDGVLVDCVQADTSSDAFVAKVAKAGAGAPVALEATFGCWSPHWLRGSGQLIAKRERRPRPLIASLRGGRPQPRSPAYLHVSASAFPASWSPTALVPDVAEVAPRGVPCAWGAGDSA